MEGVSRGFTFRKASAGTGLNASVLRNAPKKLRRFAREAASFAAHVLEPMGERELIEGGHEDDAYGSQYSGLGNRRHRSSSAHAHGARRSEHRLRVWPECSVTTQLGKERGLDSSREHDRLYRNTMQSMADGLVLGRGRHGVVVALTNDPKDARFSLAVKIVSKVFMPSGKGREGSFHRVVSHTLHVQNEVAANAKLSNDASRTFVLPLYCAFQDDLYVYLVMERACCSLQQLIKHVDDSEAKQVESAVALLVVPSPHPFPASMRRCFLPALARP